MKLAREVQEAGEEVRERPGGDTPPGDPPEITLQLVTQAQHLLRNLPVSNYRTLQHLLTHLHRVTENYDENKMSATNLGIIFGPTLLREGPGAELSVPDSLLQAQLVAFLISHQQQVFQGEECLAWPLAPTASPGGSLAAAQTRTSSSESLTLKRHSSEGYISDRSSSNEALDDSRDRRRESAGSYDLAAPVDVMRRSSEELQEFPENLPTPEQDGVPDSPTKTNFNRQPAKYQRYGQAKARAVIPKPTGLPVIVANLPPAQPQEEGVEATRGGERGQGGPDTERGHSLRGKASSRSSSPDCGTLKRSGHKPKRFEMTVQTARLVAKLQERVKPEVTEGGGAGESHTAQEPPTLAQHPTQPPAQPTNSNNNNNNTGSERAGAVGVVGADAGPGAVVGAGEGDGGILQRLKATESPQNREIHFV
eukprot:gi/632985912/ref/XP_007909946.1/ PREDICTED: GEM-interacting protein-like isoform X2 [Callorhinchus milii]